MKLAEQPLLFIDCQTTGATPLSAQILELGWLLPEVTAGQLPHSQLLIKSRLIRLPEDQALPARIQKITGITDELMQEASSAADVLSELMKDLSGGGQKQVKFAVAHYAQFEQAFVRQLFVDHLPEQNLPFTFICTCQIAKRLYPDLPSRAIRALGGYFGLSLTEMKRSSCHVEATYFIWQRLLADLGAIGIYEDDQLLEWLSQPLPKVSAKDKKNPYAIPMERLKRLDLPAKPGIYRMLNSDGKILYVGKATSLKRRVNSYFRGRKGKDSKTKELISQIFDIAIEVVDTPLEAALLETDLIKQHDPPYNRALRQRGRVLNFYSHDFVQVSLQQDLEHMLGPFVSDSFKPVLDLLQALQTETYPLDLFWGLASAELIANAFALIFIEGPIASYSAGQLNARRLLAIGMAMVRQEVNYQRILKREEERLAEAARENPDPEKSDPEKLDTEKTEIELPQEDLEEDLDAEVVEREIDENDLVEMIYGILARSAKLYLQAKRLTKLLNVQITFVDGGISKTLTFINGKAVNLSYCAPSEISQPAWSGLDIDIYDRMRVLLTELARLNLRDKGVKIVGLQTVVTQ